MVGLIVDQAEVTRLGNELKQSANVVAGAAQKVTNNLFGTGMYNGELEAGRAYKDQGKGVNDALVKVEHWLKHWSIATSATGAALGISAFQYEKTDLASAAATNQNTANL